VVTLSRDAAFMQRALFLAERGRGRTSPNPIVGAVVVSPEGVVVGHGAHLGAGGPHAEIVALDEAGDRARGSTLYSTLEPCSHMGRTGPCVERIAAAGIRRVVAATADRNPEVAGRGFAYLRARRIDVSEDIEGEAARRQLAPFFTWVTKGRPFVTLKAATSTDGFVGRSSNRVPLTGVVANRFFHRQRAEVDALAVGAGTVIADDPALTPRGAYRFRPLTRVIFDWRGRVPETARLFSTLDAGPVIMVVSHAEAPGIRARFQGLAARGVTVLPLARREIRAALEALARLEIVTLLVEGGPALHSGFGAAGLVDRVQWVATSVTLGDGVPASPAVTPGPEHSVVRRVRLGDDLLTEFDVHRTD
jgi:diaminohydroxyphosphoribosylaminopyrimidine deaminase/5-amino-6-(5-phosphoribosylamino)uracil reductase